MPQLGPKGKGCDSVGRQSTCSEPGASRPRWRCFSFRRCRRRARAGTRPPARGRRFVILPIFYDPDALKADPALHAITADGERAVEEWVEFVCPSRAAFRRRKIEYVKRLLREADPDGEGAA